MPFNFLLSEELTNVIKIAAWNGKRYSEVMDLRKKKITINCFFFLIFQNNFPQLIKVYLEYPAAWLNFIAHGLY